MELMKLLDAWMLTNEDLPSKKRGGFETIMDDLFIRWREARPEYDKFNEDGIVNKECWDRMEPSKKILFVLKETNGLTGSLVDFLKNGGNCRTWNNIARWSQMIISDTYLDYVSGLQLHDSLQKIAAINIKKQAGASHSNRKEIFEAADKDRTFLQEEIQGIDAGIIITCGFNVASVCLHDHIFKEPEDNWEKDMETGLWYYYSNLIRENKRTTVISMPHPNRAEKEYTLKLKSLIHRI